MSSNDFSFLSEKKMQHNHFLSNKIAGLDEKLASEFERRISEIYIYTAIAENPLDFNDEAKRLKLFGQMSYGFRKAAEGFTWAKVTYKEIVRQIAQAEADIKMNEYPKWVQEQKKLDPKFKSTEDYKKTYVTTVETVQKLIKLSILTENMSDEFNSLKYELSQAISTIKAICYSTKDSSYISSATVNI